jgi:23S rRNA-/tRNA-specific pseudouridylate synthase
MYVHLLAAVFCCSCFIGDNNDSVTVSALIGCRIPKSGPHLHRHNSGRKSWFRISVVARSGGKDNDWEADHRPSASPPHIPILLETDRLMIINKPAGVPHHDDVVIPINGESASNNSDEESRLGILNLLRQQLVRERGAYRNEGNQSAVCSAVPNLTTHVSEIDDIPQTGQEYAGTIPRLYGVHRLDRVTSGILILAKDPHTAGLLQRAFQRGRIVKYYVGLSPNKAIQQKQGWVQGYMVRGRRKSWYLVRPTSSIRSDTDDPSELQNRSSSADRNRAEPLLFAKTRFFTAGLGHLSVHDKTTSMPSLLPRTLILFRPFTGKTHQLRVAAKSVALPLLGDPIYGKSSATNADRTYLHATAIYIPASVFMEHENDNTPMTTLETNLSHTMSNDGVTLWCLPPFESAWGVDQKQPLFQVALNTLIRKHCDCPELLACYDSDCDGLLETTNNQR